MVSSCVGAGDALGHQDRGERAVPGTRPACAGHRRLRRCRDARSAGDGNRWLGPLDGMATGALLNLVTRQRITSFVAKEDTQTLQELCGLIEAGRLKPVIDSEYPLERAAEAVALVRDGRPAGKVVVTVAE